MITEVVLPTTVGRARLLVGNVKGARGLLILGHGAGTGARTPDLELIADGIEGVAIIRMEQPWVVSGRQIAPASHLLDEAWLEVLLKRNTWLPAAAAALPLVLGGRSTGARVACRTALPLGAIGVLALSFPLHAPKKTNRRRDSELEIILQAGLPLHVIQGDKDGFGTPAEFNGVDVTVVPGRGHELLRSRDDEHAAIVKAAARDFATRVLSL